MAGETDNLSLVQVTDTQTNKHVTINDKGGQLDAAITAFANVTVTNTNAATVTSSTLKRAVGLNIINGSPAPSAAITITVPAVSRGIIIVRNDTSYAATVTISGQPVTAPAVPAGSQLALFSDGVNVRAFNAYLASLGTMAAQNANAVAITGGSITGMPSPSGSSDVANKGYVDTAVAAGGLNGLAACVYATATVLPNSPTYSNGTAGVGATLTAGANAALVVDGVTVTSSQRILVKDQASAFQNGIYTVTTVGDGSTPWVLTRATDFDTAAEMLRNSFAFTSSGVTNAGSSWLLDATVTTVGTDAADFVQFSGATGGGRLVDARVTSGAATNVSFTSISQLFKNLIVKVRGQAAASGTSSVDLYLRINSGSGTNGYYAANNQFAGAASPTTGDNQTQLWIGCLPQSDNTFQFGQATCLINDYTSSTVKLWNSIGAYYTTAPNRLEIGGLWNVGAAVTQIDVFLNGGGAFTNGTLVELILET